LYARGTGELLNRQKSLQLTNPRDTCAGFVFFALLDLQRGKSVRSVGPMKTKNLADLYCSNPRKACQLALRRTAKLPERDRLDAINKLLGLYGTEAIRGEWQNGYWGDIVAVYCNTGDTYDTTVLQIRGEHSFYSSRFIVSSWGDWVERNEKRYAIQ
jgi:hypothetical protein